MSLLERCQESFSLLEGKLIRKTNASPNARKGYEAGWLDPDGYRRVKLDRVQYLTHRLVFLMYYGYLPEVVDHIDGDTTNNLPENLREANKASNRWNCKGNKGSQSGIKGVYKDGNRWKAMLTFGGVRYYLGMFPDKESAGEVVRKKYEELQGEFSKSLSAKE